MANESEETRLKQPGKISEDFTCHSLVMALLPPVSVQAIQSWKRPISACKRFCCLVVKSSIAAKTALYLRHKCQKYQSPNVGYRLLLYTYSSRCTLAKATFSSSGHIPLLVWLELTFHISKGGLNILLYANGNAEESTFAHNRLRWCQRRKLGLLFEQGPSAKRMTLRFTLHVFLLDNTYS